MTAAAPRRLGLALAAGMVAVTIWGGSPAATRLAVDSVDALTVGVLRSVLPTVFALPVALIAGMRLPVAGSDWLLLGLSGVGGFVGFTLLFTLGVAHTSTAHAALILAGLPIVTGLAGAIADRAVPTRRWVTGMAVAFAGEVVLITARTGHGEATLGGDLLVVAAALFAGTGYVAGSRLAPRLGTWSVTFWGIGIAGLVQAPFLPLLLPATAWDAVGPTGWAALAYLAVFSAIVGYACWYWALSVGGVARVAPLQFAQPLVSLALAVTLFAEPVTWPLLAAAAMIMGGVALARSGG